MSSTSDEIKAHNARLSSLGPVDPAAFPFTDLPTPTSSNAFCKLTAIRSGVSSMALSFYLAGVKKSETWDAPCFCFLVEKKKLEDGSMKRVMFELGVREAAKFNAQHYKVYAQMGGFVAAPGSTAAILTSHNIPLDSISGLILGHAHMDHFGNLADFPLSMSMLVGPGLHVGDELAKEMDVPVEVISSRTVRQLSRAEDKWETIGALKGFDYFGDGSLWVLDISGHKVGHLGAFVRTSIDPPVDYVLGSDAAHAITLLTQTRRDKVGLWPESLVDPTASTEKLTSIHANLEEAYDSMAKLRRMELEENVHVFLSHDGSMDLILPKEEDFITLEGTLEEVARLKKRNQSVY